MDTPEPSFPARTVPGLVWAFAFSPGAVPLALRDDEVQAALERDDLRLWLHFRLSDARGRDWITQFPGLPSQARDLFASTDERLRVEGDAAATFGILTDFQLEFDGTGDDFGHLRFAFSDRIVITARRQALHSVEETRQSLERGTEMANTAGVVELIVECFCEGATRMVSRLNNELDHIEDHVVLERVEDERRHLVPIRRSAVVLHRQLFGMAGLFRFWHLKRAGVSRELDTETLVARLEGLNGDLATAQERARLLQDEISARLAEETSRSLKALSIMSALLLPGSLIAGLFGMNAGPVPYSTTEGGFWYALVICALATLAFGMILRRIGFRF